MELLEYTARHLHFYLSDFHYIEKLMVARAFLYEQIENYPLEEWICAYEYIFHEDVHQDFMTAREVYEAIYEQAKMKGTPFDPVNGKLEKAKKHSFTCMMGK